MVPEIKVKVGADVDGGVAGLKRVADEASKTSKQFDKAAASSGQAAKGFSFAGHGARQMGMQLSQVGQQTMATGNFIQALAIQLPDIGLAFGTVGIAAGLLSGIALPILADAFGFTGGKAQSLSDDIDELSEAVKASRSATKDAGSSAIDMSKKYGVVSEELRTVLADFAAIEKLNAARAIDETTAALNALATSSGFFDDVKSRVGKATEFLFGYYNVLKEGQVEAGALFARNLKLLESSTDNAKRLQAAMDLRDQLLENSGGIEGMNAEQLEFFQGLGKTIQQMEILRGGADGVTSSLGAATNQALSLRDALAAAGTASLSRRGQIAVLTSQIAAAERGASVAGAKAATQTQQALASTGATVDQIAAASSKAAAEATKIEGLSKRLSDLTKPAKAAGGVDPNAARISALVESLKTEEETLTAWYEQSTSLLAAANAAELEALGGQNEAKLRLEEEYQERLSVLRTGWNGDALQQAGAFFGDMAGAFQSGNEKMLKISQSFAAAQGMINAYKAFTDALASSEVSIWQRIPLGLSLLGAGMNMVNAIKGIGSSGGGSGGGAGAAAGASAAQAPTPVDITVTGLAPDKIFTGNAVSELLNQFQDVLEDRGGSLTIA